MTLHRPLLIASCPGRSVESVKSEVRLAADAGADVAEVRLDRLAVKERSRWSKLFPAPIPLMATLRSRAEGGEGPDEADQRAPLLDSASRLPFRFLDLERARDAAFFDRENPVPGKLTGVVVSSHFSGSVPTAEVRRLLELPRPSGAVAKVVLPCNFERLWSDLLPGLSAFETYAPYILHTTGPTGPILRTWAGRLGMFAVYASLPAADPAVRHETVEPAQLPVDRLRAYADTASEGPLFAVVGHPITHTRSPEIHSFWMEHERRRGLYLALDMESARELADSLEPLASGGFKGLNVTHPWKRIALSLASRASSVAETAACANTLSFDSGTVSAENTDVAAVRRRLSELRDAGVWDGSPVVVLGAGGAARSVLTATASLGSSGIVLARRKEEAAGLAREYGGTVGTKARLKPARVVINATPGGRETEPRLELPWTDAIDSSTHLLDFVYAPAHPFLQVGARAKGATYEDGSRLLVYQAAESYAIWWGSAPKSDLQVAALKEVLRAA
jgi:shikimate dehydrogenase